MAGHSQFKNIMHKKGKQDAIRSKLFSKLAREITVAAKMGLPDPAMNARLRAAVLEARAENMPKDNIDRAIKKASSADTENYDEVRYEGYAPGGVAVIVEALTDNRNRTAGEVRSYFTKAGGSLAETGAVSFMFDRVGLIVFDRKVADDEAMLEAAIEAGADDVVSGPEEHEVITSVEALRDAQKALGGEVRRAREGRRSSGDRRTPSPSMTRRAKRSCASSARSKTTTTSRPSPRTSRSPRRYWRRWRASAARRAALSRSRASDAAAAAPRAPPAMVDRSEAVVKRAPAAAPAPAMPAAAPTIASMPAPSAMPAAMPAAVPAAMPPDGLNVRADDRLLERWGESVKADEGALEAASIVAPATAAIAPRDRMRKIHGFLQVSEQLSELWSYRLNLG